jgi:hypothetical protein
MENMDFNFDFNGFEIDFDIKGFDINLSLDDKTDNGFCKPKLTKPKRVIYDNAVKMAQDIKLEKDMSVYSIVSGNFIFGDLLEALIINNHVKVKKLYISTLSLSENNVDSLVNIMLSGLCDELHLVVSSYFYSHERGNLVKYIYQELEQEKPWKFFFSVAGTHMKLALIETDELKITMQGSANLRSSGNIEQFSMTDDVDLFEFNKEYIEIIEESYRINKKSGDRGNKLWHQVQKLKKVKKQEQGRKAQQKQDE